MSAAVKGLYLPVKMNPSSPALAREAFVFEYLAQFAMENVVDQSPFTFVSVGSSLLSLGVNGISASTQSIGWLYSSRPYFLQKSVFAPPSIRGSGSSLRSARVGGSFLLVDFD
jgi:hypothetical protein